ncbi:hypothetical protein L5515_000052 [Caenorhabditis briggsae]|uniref:Uncharacterized protein n=1 Tax=Caenorhabditis briggsae TaxID=6238 RepID=A0AAE9J0V2_CAEBR|nr:hypothetical protein L5515_000052 [Caenorhabditis briggsae]
MESKPILFCDTTTVLTYMEANFRFNLAQKIPSIRKAEKAAPLVINRLELHDNRLIVNDTEYKMKVYRECQTGGWSSDEVDYDFDGKGFQISLDESIQPGDVLFFYDGNEHRQRKWLAHDCPEIKSSLPCNHYIRLYVAGSMYELPYKSMKIYQLMKRLLTMFIGNRRGEWIIKDFRPQNNVLRWPVDTRKPIVRNFDIGTYRHNKIDGLQPIIDTSVPIPILKMRATSITIEDHPLLKNVEHLMISNHLFTYDFSDLFSIQTPNVTLTTPAPLDKFTLGRLISKLMEKPRPIGVRYSILVRKKMNLNQYSHPAEIRKYKDAIRLAMGSEAVAVIRYSKRRSKTWLIIEVVAKN